MAQITITEILGSDNMAASRATIQSNFKILADEANKIESFLNTSPVGGTLSIGKITVTNKDKNDTDIELFTCEGSGDFHGNLEVDKALTVYGGLTVAGGANPTDLGKEATVEAFSSKSATTDAIIVNKSDAQPSQEEINIAGKSMLNIEFGDDSTAGSPSAYPNYKLMNGEVGQLIMITFEHSACEGTLTFDNGDVFKVSTDNVTTGSPQSLDFSNSIAVFYITGSDDTSSKKVLVVSANNCTVTK